MVNLLVYVERNRWTHGVRWEKIREKKIDTDPPALSATDFICVYNKFFHSNPGVRVKQIFFRIVCMSSVLRHWEKRPSYFRVYSAVH